MKSDSAERKVKIVCTIGPASSSKNVIEKMIRAGMDVARLNFSHGDHEGHQKAVGHIRKAARKYDSPVAVLLDLKGLKIRVGAVKDGSIILKKNSTVILTTKQIEGSSERISISYRHLLRM